VEEHRWESSAAEERRWESNTVQERVCRRRTYLRTSTPVCASLFDYAWFLVACVRSKKFIKFCEKV
jgi:hypothetical protein